jgi:hypothetical protein
VPHIRINGQRIEDPGGDPAAPGLHGQTSSGGFAEGRGKVVSTQAAGWRQLLIDRGGAVSSA